MATKKQKTSKNRNILYIPVIVAFIVGLIILIIFLVKSKENTKTSTPNKQSSSENNTKIELLVPAVPISYSKESINPQTYKFILKLDNNDMTFQDIKDIYTATATPNTKVTLRELINALSYILQKGTDFKGYYFEVINVKKSELSSKVFEFVLIETTFSDVQDPKSYNNHLNTPAKAVVFNNLSKPTAKLVCPHKGTGSYYAHLSIFSRNASDDEVQQLWLLAFKTYFEEMEKGNAIYLSTHGKGVNWLHIRIETTPKYYSYNEYK